MVMDISDYKSGMVLFCAAIENEDQAQIAKDWCAEKGLTKEDVSIRIRTDKTIEKYKFVVVIKK